MARTEMEVIEAVLGSAFEGRLADIYDLLSEDFFAQTSRGHVYVGHEGFSEWVKDTMGLYRDRRFEMAETRLLGGGLVLVAGTVTRTLRDGRPEAQPGAWLIHVREESLAAVVFFRTRSEALAAVARERPTATLAIVDRAIEAFNHRDHRSLLALMGAEFESPIGEGDRLKGIGAAAAMLKSIEGAHAEYDIEWHRSHDLGDGYVAVETIARVRAHDEERIERVERAWLARIVNGVLVEVNCSDDLAAATVAAGKGNRDAT